jgi:hypothetical protein
VFPALQVKDDDKCKRKKVITQVGQRHEIREPGNDPPFHPDRGMYSKKEEVHAYQPRVDVLLEMLDQIPQGFVNENDEYQRGKIVEQGPRFPLTLSIR